MNRGEIYYVSIPSATGQEMTKGRPAVILSSDEVAEQENVVAVAFCSASEHRDAPYRILIRSTPRPSTVLCEHIYTVDKSRISTYIGRVTSAELGRIDLAVASSLGLDFTASRVTSAPPPQRIGGA